MPLKIMYRKSSTLRLPRKQKRREMLSVNMISLPLGDFRHLSHIGLDARGDSFGDLSSLQRSSSLILRGPHGHQELILTGTPNGTPPPPPKPPRLLSPEEREAQAIHPSTHKKCHSLPLLDTLETIEPKQNLIRQTAAVHENWVEQQEEGLRMKPEISELDGNTGQDLRPAELGLVEDDQSFALNLDLGPSILEDVLQVMDKLQES